jgi:hypothetical protein
MEENLHSRLLSDRKSEKPRNRIPIPKSVDPDPTRTNRAKGRATTEPRTGLEVECFGEDFDEDFVQDFDGGFDEDFDEDFDRERNCLEV